MKEIMWALPLNNRYILLGDLNDVWADLKKIWNSSGFSQVNP